MARKVGLISEVPFLVKIILQVVKMISQLNSMYMFRNSITMKSASLGAYKSYLLSRLNSCEDKSCHNCNINRSFNEQVVLESRNDL